MHKLQQTPRKDSSNPRPQFFLVSTLRELALSPVSKQYKKYFESVQSCCTGDAKYALLELSKLATSPIYRQAARSCLSKIVCELEKEVRATGKESLTAETLRTQALDCLYSSMTSTYDAKKAIKRHIGIMMREQEPLERLVWINNFLAQQLVKEMPDDLKIINLGICEGALEIMKSTSAKYEKSEEFAFQKFDEHLATEKLLAQLKDNMKVAEVRLAFMRTEAEYAARRAA